LVVVVVVELTAVAVAAEVSFDTRTLSQSLRKRK
jgi:hypothetical protein